jgi:hypothetical protein
MGQTKDIRNGNLQVPGEDDREGTRKHEGAEGYVLLAGGAAGCQQRDAVDGGE